MTAVFSSLIWDVFFIPPRYSFTIASPEDGLLLTMHFIVATISGVQTHKIRRMQKVARKKEEKAQALKMYNTVLNSLSHELRTPIATIIGATDSLMSDKQKLSAVYRQELLGVISRSSLRLNRQAENLLNMPRIESIVEGQSNLVSARKAYSACFSGFTLINAIRASGSEQYPPATHDLRI